MYRENIGVYKFQVFNQWTRHKELLSTYGQSDALIFTRLSSRHSFVISEERYSKREVSVLAFAKIIAILF